MKSTFSRNLKAFTLCAGFFSLVACKEKGVTKTGLIPDIDNIHTFGLNESFFTPTVNVGRYDSLITNDYTYLFSGIGRMSDDPFFGTTESSLYIQFVPQLGFTRFPAGTVIDSATIAMPYVVNAQYGDSSKTTSNFQYMKVYRITDENFRKTTDVNFYSFTTFATQATPIGSGAFDFKNITDTFKSPVDTFSGQLRIRLSNSFVNEIATADSTKFQNPTAFREFIRGFYIAAFDTIATQRRISYFALSGSTINSSARLELHTRNASNQYVKISFPFSPDNCAFSNYIKRNYTGKPAESFTNSTANRDSIVIQGYPGIYSEITIKNIDQIPPSVINKAKLLITRLPVGLENYYYSPPQLLPQGIGANGTRYTIADLLTNGGAASGSGYAFVDGKPNEVTINGTKYIQYALNFPRELQLAINAGKKELKLRVSSITAPPGAYRMVAGGPNTSDDTKIRLEVIYTKID